MSERTAFFLAILAYVLYLAIGTAVYSDFGISWDEPIDRSTGYVNLKYIANYLGYNELAMALNYPDLPNYVDRDYGPVFQVSLAMLEVLLGHHISPGEYTYKLRHLITFLICALGVLAIWKTLYLRWASYRVALVGALIFVISPRLFAESFYNGKDMVFLAAFAVGIWTMTRLLIRPGVATAVVHGLATAIAVDIRITAVFLAAVTIGVLVVRMIKRETGVTQGCITLGVYLSIAAAGTVIFWPFLWADPVGNFVEAFRNMSQFRWDGVVRFKGELVAAANLPWDYIPVWIGITLPLSTLFLFLTGAIVVLANSLKARGLLWNDQGEMLDLTYLVLAVGPIAAVISFQSVLYDGWRQMYFVYPGLILVAVCGLIALQKMTQEKFVLQSALYLAVVINLGWCINWMVNSHPLQNVYFNALAGSDWKSKFEVDYWGLSTSEALIWIAKQESTLEDNSLISFSPISALPTDRGLMGLPAGIRNKFYTENYWELKQDGGEVPPRAQYLMTNFRGVPRPYLDSVPAGYSLVHERLAGSEPVYRIFKRTDSAADAGVALSAYEAKNLSDVRYELTELKIDNTLEDKRAQLIVALSKATNPPVLAMSASQNPIRLSWRFLNADGEAMSGFDFSQDLPANVPAGGSIDVKIAIGLPNDAGAIEISAVQDGVFWLHEIGVPTLVIPVN